MPLYFTAHSLSFSSPPPLKPAHRKASKVRTQNLPIKNRAMCTAIAELLIFINCFPNFYWIMCRLVTLLFYVNIFKTFYFEIQQRDNLSKLGISDRMSSNCVPQHGLFLVLIRIGSSLNYGGSKSGASCCGSAVRGVL